MPTEPLLSILIPYYNMPHSLPRLLDNILAQSLKSLEVIIVDDGSREPCREAVDVYREQGLDVRIVEHGVNKGTKEARLSGVEHARGRVIAFADADDLFLGSEALEYHVRLLLREEADIMHFSTLARHPEKGTVSLLRHGQPFAPILTGQDVFSAYAEGGRGHGLWQKLYAASLCRAILPAARSFAMHRLAEDRFLTALLFSQAQRYRGSERAGYFYHITPASNLSIRAPQKLGTIHSMTKWLITWLRDGNFSPAIINTYEAHAKRGILWHAAQLEKACHSSNPDVSYLAMLRTVLDGADMAVMERALAYALTEGGGGFVAQDALKLREGISKLKCSHLDNHDG